MAWKDECSKGFKDKDNSKLASNIMSRQETIFWDKNAGHSSNIPKRHDKNAPLIIEMVSTLINSGFENIGKLLELFFEYHCIYKI